MELDKFGWNAAWADAFAAQAVEGQVPARVMRVDRGRVLLAAEAGEWTGEPSGALWQEGAGLPVVGDWVAVELPETGEIARIEAILPRRSAFSRKVPGERTAEQVLVANVDTVFLVSGLDRDYNPRRIERYLAAGYASGAAPVIVLNKADQLPDPDAVRMEVEAVAPGVPVVLLSALHGDIEELEHHLKPAKTYALLGSSGVGKSTLLNRLCGDERMATGAVREDDSRGRHTTTRRELVVLPGGALLIDTPGLRELQLWAGEGDVEAVFPDIEIFAAHCRYRDCTHDGEPGCAVAEAVDAGSLAEARIASFRKLQREQAYLERRQDPVEAANSKHRWKQIHKEVRRMQKERGRE